MTRMTGWKRTVNNAAVIVALVALLLGYSVFVVLPAWLLVLWLLRLGHGPVRVASRAKGAGRLLESRPVQALVLAALVGGEFVRSGLVSAIALAILLLFSVWFSERFLYREVRAPAN